MRLAKTFTSIAVAASVVAAPIAAQAAPSMDQARAGSQIEGEELGGGFVIPVILLVAVLVGALLIFNDGDDPVSP